MAAPAGKENRDPFWFMTTSHSGSANKASGLDRVLVQVGKYYDGRYNTSVKNAKLPLTHYDVSHDKDIVNKFFQYMLVYPIVSPVMNHPGVGDELEDRKRGVHHIHIGGRTGVIKKVSFARTDIQYIRESRFLNQGDDGLLQLGAVYKATIDMVGNTLWFPGMELYINPLGMGGLELGFPNDSKSAANKLGLGGYHLITRIKSTIAPGVFNTQVEAQFFYSGDKTADKQRLGFFKDDEKKSIVRTQEKISPACATILESLEKGAAHLQSKLQRLDTPSSYAEEQNRAATNTEELSKAATMSPQIDLFLVPDESIEKNPIINDTIRRQLRIDRMKKKGEITGVSTEAKVEEMEEAERQRRQEAMDDSIEY